MNLIDPLAGMAEDFDSESLREVEGTLGLWREMLDELRDAAADWYNNRHRDDWDTNPEWTCEDSDCSCRIAYAFYESFDTSLEQHPSLTSAVFKVRLNAASALLRVLLGCWIPFTPRTD